MSQIGNVSTEEVSDLNQGLDLDPDQDQTLVSAQETDLKNDAMLGIRIITLGS